MIGVINPWKFPAALCHACCHTGLTSRKCRRSEAGRSKRDRGGVIAELFAAEGLPEGILHLLASDTEPGQAWCRAR
ncbi:hypothetical protein [Rhodococcus erythropolis]|uniref:hypothetical protein n=1 Tax=Rhodococcus erythropolis TaxID=1833 RepID=UPI0039081605